MASQLETAPANLKYGNLRSTGSYKEVYATAETSIKVRKGQKM